MIKHAKGGGALAPQKSIAASTSGTKAPPPGYKQTKVGVIPEDWGCLPARNYFDKRIAKGYDGLVTYSVTINKSWQKRSELNRETGTELSPDKSLLAEKGDLVYNTMRMWQGALGMAENSGVVSPAYIVLRPKSMINSKFAFYMLKSYTYLHYLTSYSYGLTSDRLRLYFKDFGMIPFICPPLKEQEKIAKILTTWDDAISKQETLIKAKEELKKGLMQKLLSGEVRFGEFGAGTLVPSNSIEKKGTEVPAPGGREEVRLEDIAKINPKNNTLPKSFVYIDLESVTKGILLKESMIYRDDAPSRAQRLLKKDDILYQTVRPYQKNNFFFNLNGNYVASTGYAQIRALESSEYLYHYLHWDEFVRKVLLRCTGTSYPAINSTDLAKIKIKLPTKQEQQKIAQVLTLADKEINLLKNELEALKEQKRGLMQRLLTGEVRVVV